MYLNELDEFPPLSIYSKLFINYLFILPFIAQIVYPCGANWEHLNTTACKYDFLCSSDKIIVSILLFL